MSQIQNLGGGTPTNSGTVIQRVRTFTNAFVSTTSILPFDDTIPQIVEGTQLFSLNITPTDASNILEFKFSAMVASNAIRTVNFALFEDASISAIYATSTTVATAYTDIASWNYSQVAGTTSPLSFKVRFGTNAVPSVTINGSGVARVFGGVAEASFTIIERLP